MAWLGVMGWVRRVTAFGVAASVIGGFTGCMSSEAAHVRALSARGLKCTDDELNIVQSRSLPELREWLAGCNFTVMRVYCDNDGRCYRPPPKIPCIGSAECPKDVFEDHGQPDLLWGSSN